MLPERKNVDVKQKTNSSHFKNVSVDFFEVAYACHVCSHEATRRMLLCIYTGYLMTNLGLVQLDAVRMKLPNCTLRLQSNKKYKC